MSHLCQWRRGSPGKCEHGNSSIYAPGVGVQGMSHALCLSARKETSDVAGADGSGDRMRNRRRRQNLEGRDPRLQHHPFQSRRARRHVRRLVHRPRRSRVSNGLRIDQETRDWAFEITITLGRRIVRAVVMVALLPVAAARRVASRGSAERPEARAPAQVAVSPAGPGYDGPWRTCIACRRCRSVLEPTGRTRRRLLSRSLFAPLPTPGRPYRRAETAQGSARCRVAP
jgi:hypothetical protein